ncbi:hypothetical protein Clacol_010508 [Clathrus columnatus]|uniref:Alpha-type protein kinase domain-containing protein n=1 Tax=Clathrus columnatus TaxID=1419009 RepID=A0AAV5AR14_9AGAM|nr:hypothetical protein Clacol_010508 [Clathrus columnatus]
MTTATSVLEHVRTSLQVPLNPRQPNVDLHHFIMPAKVIDPNEIQQSEETMSRLLSSWTESRELINKPENLQKSKISSNFVISSGRSNPKKPSQINVVTHEELGHARSWNVFVDKPWKDIVKVFAGMVRGEISERFNIEIDVTNIILCNYVGGKSFLYPDERTRGGVCETFVAFTNEQTIEFHNQSKKALQSIRAKRAPKTDVEGGIEVVKRPSTGPYLTQFVQSEKVAVWRIDMTLGSDKVISSTRSKDTIVLEISSNPIASGRMKNMYRAVWGNDVFAAKCFDDLKPLVDKVSNADNQSHIQNELSRHITATHLGVQFVEFAKSKGVQVYEKFTFSDSWIAVVADGPRPGWAYLMAPMLSTRDVIKFSGTNTAGANESNRGKTMDTFAHFSLFITEEDLVLTDIQEGILTPEYVEGYQFSEMLTLFDLMTHTKNGNSGLGDDGVDGIERFKKQHRCNSLCERLRLSDSESFDAGSLDLKRSRRTLSLDTETLNNPSSSARSKRSRLFTNVSSSSSLVEPISNPQSPITISDGSSQQKNQEIVVDVEITVWGRRKNDDGEFIEAELLPNVGEEKKGLLQINLDEGELYNLDRLKLWRVKLQTDEISAAYTPHVAFETTDEEFKGAAINSEMQRFYELRNLYQEFESLAISKDVVIARLNFDYQLLRYIKNRKEELELLCGSVSAYSKIYYFFNDMELTNILIKATLVAFSHFSYEAYGKDVVHTDWACKEIFLW